MPRRRDMKLTAKLTPFAINTTLVTDFVPPPHGSTHWPEELSLEQEEPTPATGSYPAANARDWKRVIEYPFGPTPLSPLS
jgi:hypothetical protein